MATFSHIIPSNSHMLLTSHARTFWDATQSSPIPTPAAHKHAPQLPIDLVVLLAQIQQLMAMVQALQHQNQLLQDQIDAHPLVPAAPIPAPAIVPEVRIAMPDPYDGSLEKTEHFLHQCKVYFLGLPSLTAHQHMTFAISYMNKGHTSLG
jgi:hypothetical protein